jgi:acyl phosphate:glycerol-3-phosphate acyltransferase
LTPLKRPIPIARVEHFYPLVAYLLGSIPTAIFVARVLGLPDPRTVGSGNPGATNVLRHGGKLAALLTLLGDVGKGVVAVGLARWLSVDPLTWTLCAFAVFVGHLYPVFFGFKGGKGVATALGAWLTLNPAIGGLLLLTWVAVAALFRYSSLAALVAAIAAPLYVLWLLPLREYLVMSVAMSVLLIWRHRSNIQKLLAGTEGRIGR